MMTERTPNPDDTTYAVALAIQAAVESLTQQIPTKDQVAKLDEMVTALNNENATYGRELADLHTKVDFLSDKVTALIESVESFRSEQLEVREYLRHED